MLNNSVIYLNNLTINIINFRYQPLGLDTYIFSIVAALIAYTFANLNRKSLIASPICKHIGKLHELCFNQNLPKSLFNFLIVLDIF